MFTIYSGTIRHRLRTLFALTTAIAVLMVLIPYVWSFRRVEAVVFVDKFQVAAIEQEVRNASSGLPGLETLKTDARLNAFVFTCRARNASAITNALSGHVDDVEILLNNRALQTAHQSPAVVLPGLMLQP